MAARMVLAEKANRARWIALGAMLFFSISGQAVEPKPGSEAPGFESVVIPGLSHESVSAIVQDQQGFLWFGTWDGLDRWDGIEIESHTHQPEQPGTLVNSDIASLLVDDDGALWIASLGGVDRHDQESATFTHYDLPLPSADDQRPSTFRWGLYQTSDGTIWVGSRDGLFVLIPGSDDFVRVSLQEEGRPVDSSGVIRLQEDDRGHLWLLKSGGWPLQQAVLYRASGWSAPLKSLAVTSVDIESPRTVSFLVDSDDRIWAGGAEARTLVSGTSSVSGFSGANESLASTAHLEDASGRVWIGTTSGLFLSGLRGSSATRVPLGDKSGFVDDYVLSIFEDRSGAIWVTTIAGVFRHDPAAKPFLTMAENVQEPSKGLTTNRVASISATSEGSIWVGTWGSGIDHIDGKSGLVTNYPEGNGDPGSLPPADMHLVHVDDMSRIWVAAGHHVCELITADGYFDCYRPAVSTTDTFWNMVGAPGGQIYLASNNLGLVEFDTHTGQFSHHLESRGFSKSIQAMTLAGDALWLVDIEANLYRYQPEDRSVSQFGPLLSDPARSRSVRGIYDLHAEPDGSLWIGTSEGLLHFDSGSTRTRIFTRTDGLPGSHVYSVLSDDSERIWAGTNRGLIRIDRMSGPAVEIRSFDRTDGIGGMEFNRRAGFRDANGHLYFGGKEGITWFDPGEIRDNDYVPPLALSSVTVNDLEGNTRQELAHSNSFRLGPRDHAISFQFAALSFSHPQKNQFRYRLADLDENWVEAGTRRFVTYTALPPGQYEFQLQGSNHDGVWNEAGIRAAITVAPPFWATWWFRALMVATALGLLTLIYRWRVARLIEIERLRVRIAGDLHDDLSSDLSGIALTMDLLEKNAQLSEADQQRVSRVRQTAISMIDGVRDLVWYLDSGQDSIESLWLRMRQVAETLLAGRNLVMEIEAPEKPVAIDMSVRKHIYLMFKEVLHNIVKHSSADTVEVNLVLSGSRLDLKVSDNGVGFDAANDSDGYGIISLQRRTEQLDGSLNIASRQTTGTVVSFSVDLDRATSRKAG